MCIIRLLEKLKSLLSKQPQSKDHLRLGADGERLAAQFLKRSKYRVLARDFRCDAGQIDLIVSRDGVVAFVEVKTRTRDLHVDKLPVSSKQQARIGRAAQFFLSKKRLTDRPARFDLVFITWPPDQDPTIEHVENAFVPGKR